MGSTSRNARSRWAGATVCCMRIMRGGVQGCRGAGSAHGAGQMCRRLWVSAQGVRCVGFPEFTDFCLV